MNVPIIGIANVICLIVPCVLRRFTRCVKIHSQCRRGYCTVDGLETVRASVDIENAVKKIHENGLFERGCSNLEEGLYCKALGFDIVR